MKEFKGSCDCTTQTTIKTNGKFLKLNSKVLKQTVFDMLPDELDTSNLHIDIEVSINNKRYDTTK